MLQHQNMMSIVTKLICHHLMEEWETQGTIKAMIITMHRHSFWLSSLVHQIYISMILLTNKKFKNISKSPLQKTIRNHFSIQLKQPIQSLRMCFSSYLKKIRKSTMPSCVNHNQHCRYQSPGIWQLEIHLKLKNK